LLAAADRGVQGYVYFIQEGEAGSIKIGRAAEPSRRVSSLQTGNPRKLHLRVYARGDEKTETELHRFLKESRLGGEWFALCPALREFLENARRFR